MSTTNSSLCQICKEEFQKPEDIETEICLDCILECERGCAYL